MFSNFSNAARNLFYTATLPVWVFVGFMIAQVLVVLGMSLLQLLGLTFEAVNPFVFNAILSVLVYTLAISVVVGVPWLIRKKRTTAADLGLERPPSLKDVAWVPAGAVVYLILSALITTIAVLLAPWFNAEQVQDTGFAGISGAFEYSLAFIILVFVAPFAEELLFRGYLFGKLRKHTKVWVAVLLTSVLFALVHFQWNVGLDVFALSIVLCVLRVLTGSLWSALFLHMLKNGFAYYLLFVNPTLLSTLGG